MCGFFWPQKNGFGSIISIYRIYKANTGNLWDKDNKDGFIQKRRTDPHIHIIATQIYNTVLMQRGMKQRIPVFLKISDKYMARKIQSFTPNFAISIAP